jgi:hypothetical protein
MDAMQQQRKNNSVGRQVAVASAPPSVLRRDDFLSEGHRKIAFFMMENILIFSH